MDQLAGQQLQHFGLAYFLLLLPLSQSLVVCGVSKLSNVFMRKCFAKLTGLPTKQTVDWEGAV